MTRHLLFTAQGLVKTIQEAVKMKRKQEVSMKMKTIMVRWRDGCVKHAGAGQPIFRVLMADVYL